MLQQIFMLFLLIAVNIQAAELAFPKSAAEWTQALNPTVSKPKRGRFVSQGSRFTAQNVAISNDPPRAGAIVHFAFDSDQIPKTANPDLDALGQALQDPSQLGDISLTIEGHTDSKGSAAYNLKLSQSRAAAVQKYLLDNYNIAQDRLAINGYGEQRPRKSNATAWGRSQNRRVEFVRKQ